MGTRLFVCGSAFWMCLLCDGEQPRGKLERANNKNKKSFSEEKLFEWNYNVLLFCKIILCLHKEHSTWELSCVSCKCYPVSPVAGYDLEYLQCNTYWFISDSKHSKHSLVEPAWFVRITRRKTTHQNSHLIVFY